MQRYKLILNPKETVLTFVTTVFFVFLIYTEAGIYEVLG